MYISVDVHTHVKVYSFNFIRGYLYCKGTLVSRYEPTLQLVFQAVRLGSTSISIANLIAPSSQLVSPQRT